MRVLYRTGLLVFSGVCGLLGQGTRLEPGRPIERTLTPPASDVFVVSAEAGQFLHVTAEQKGVDLILSIADPAGRTVAGMDSPNGEFGFEHVSVRVDAAGAYQIKVASKPGGLAGAYRIELAALREFSEPDRARLEAEEVWRAAGAADRTGTAAGARRALEEYEKATGLWHSLGEAYEEALGLHRAGLMYFNLGENAKAIERYEQALAMRRSTGDRSGEAASLNNLGLAAAAARGFPRSIELLTESLAAARAVGDRVGEARTRHNLGLVWLASGENQKAIDAFREALPSRRGIGDRAGEAATLYETGCAYTALGEKQKALEAFEGAAVLSRGAAAVPGGAPAAGAVRPLYLDRGTPQRAALDAYAQAAELAHRIGDRYTEIVALTTIGMAQKGLGDLAKALESLERAAALRHEAGDRVGVAQTLSSIAEVHTAHEERPKAVEALQQALAIRHELADRAAEIDTLNVIANLYDQMSEYQKGLEAYGQAAGMARARNDRAREAALQERVGDMQWGLGRRTEATETYRQAAAVWHADGNAKEEASTLARLAGLYSSMGEKPKAIEAYDRSAALYETAGDRNGEARVLHSLGTTYSSMGDRQKELASIERELELRRAVGDRRAVATVLHSLAPLYRRMGDGRREMETYREEAAILSAAGDRLGQATALHSLGGAYTALNQPQGALDAYREETALRHAANDRSGEASALVATGTVVGKMGDVSAAAGMFEQAVTLWHSQSSRFNEASGLNDIGEAYFAMGEKQKGIEAHRQSLAIRRTAGSPAAVALGLSRLARAYSAVGDKRNAVDTYQELRALRRERGDRAGEAVALNGMGRLYGNSGEMQKALDCYREVLPLYRAANDRAGEAQALNSIGLTYMRIGDSRQAMGFLEQALSRYADAGDRLGQSKALNNLGIVHANLGDQKKAVANYEEALALHRALNDRTGEAKTLNNIGTIYSRQKEYRKAIDYYQQASVLEQASGNRASEGLALSNIGNSYLSLGDRERALEFYRQALPIQRAVGDRQHEVTTLNGLQRLFRQSQPDLAIVFGKQAVGVMQSVRQDNADLEEELQAVFEKSIESYYRSLAGLLIERQRFGEAEEVLNLLKSRETRDFAQRDSISDRLRSATLLESEKKVLERYDQIVGQIVQLGQRRSDLIAKRDQASLTGSEAEESGRLSRDLSAANTVLRDFFEEQKKAFAANSGTAKRIGEFKEAEGLQDVLRKLGPGVVAIYTLVTPDQYVAMLVTSGTRKAYTTAIQETDLNRKIFAFRQALQSPSSDPVPLARELYRVVFPEGLRQDLDALQAKTIMWSIDSTLRYIPMAALHDGQDYLVKSFQNSLITPLSLSYLTEEPARQWEGAGFGVSNANPPLPSVPLELNSIFGKGAGAAMPGTVRLNGDFTLENLKNDLERKRNRVVHIATHFDSRPGVAANSHLLLGDGEVGLDKIEAEDLLFSGVDLLTLSACNTAFTNRAEDGREVDSFGTIAQRLGARGVIASLWSVNDPATAAFMQEMYRLRQQDGLTKGEALRRAQAAMQGGGLRPGATETANRGGSPVETTKARRDWSHPFYWAPFILIGNWK